MQNPVHLKIRFAISIFFFMHVCSLTEAQENVEIISKGDLDFLKQMTKAIIDSARIAPGQTISSSFGPNNAGMTLIRPGGREAYPSFWIRDYAMSVETGFISLEEQKQLLLLTARTQSDKTWKTKKGGLIPKGSIADHIRIDNLKPIFFPGTYDENEQGDGRFGYAPPICDQYFFIQMAYFYLKQSKNTKILLDYVNHIPLITRLQNAFEVPPSHKENEIVYTTNSTRAVDFGFRDAIIITGDLCMSSILKYNAAKQLAFCYRMLNDKTKADKYLRVADKLKKSIPVLFQMKNGMLMASTGKSNQPDVWATALAIHLNILEKHNAKKASVVLNDAYSKGNLTYNGNIRHVPTTEDFNTQTMWEISLAEKNTYQNGAYWGTPVGWVCSAIFKTNPRNAMKLASEYISDLREHDFRKGGDEGAPYECINDNGYKQNPLYMTSVASPFIVFNNWHFIHQQKKSK